MSGKFVFTCESRDQINEMFFFRQFMSILKFSGKFITIGLMLTYNAYVSLGRIEELLLLENLLDINFFAPSKSLTVVTGPVGSGKSTLLSRERW